MIERASKNKRRKIDRDNKKRERQNERTKEHQVEIKIERARQYIKRA